MLGSVTERILRESPVPLLTVRAAPQGPVRRILSPIDGTEASRNSFRLAARLGACFDAEITAVYVHEHGTAQSAPDLCNWIPAEARQRCNIRELVRHGDPAEEIVALASEEKFDLLVIGAPQRKFFEGLVLGTTTLRAVRHAPCPVLTVSGPGEVR
jgi:nucleotide-binding universal stress UspA family protein